MPLDAITRAPVDAMRSVGFGYVDRPRVDVYAPAAPKSTAKTTKPKAKTAAKPNAKPKPKRAPAKKKKAPTPETAGQIVCVPPANSTQRVKSKIYNLTLDVNALQQQVMTLEQHRALLSTRALYSPFGDDGSVMRKTVQYFASFQRGFHPSHHQTTAFVSSITDEDLSLGITGFGRDMLMEQWRRYTAYFGMRRCDVPAPRVIAVDDDAMTCTVRAELAFEGSFTPTALAMVFPAVLRDPDLTQELLDKNLEATAVFHLHFDQNGMMVRHDVDTDFFAVLVKALGDPVRAAEIMQVTTVAEESMLVATDEAAHTPIEPLEQAARAKRSRFTVVNEDDENGGGSPSEVVGFEPDEEPTYAKDSRLTLDYLLSPSDEDQ